MISLKTCFPLNISEGNIIAHKNSDRICKLYNEHIQLQLLFYLKDLHNMKKNLKWPKSFVVRFKDSVA